MLTPRVHFHCVHNITGDILSIIFIVYLTWAEHEEQSLFGYLLASPFKVTQHTLTIYLLELQLSICGIKIPAMKFYGHLPLRTNQPQFDWS